jgi:hypothetical protein
VRAVATWSYLANISPAPLWKFYGGVGLTFSFALAGLTRRAGDQIFDGDLDHHDAIFARIRECFGSLDLPGDRSFVDRG